MTEPVLLDASAVLAYLGGERGAGRVADALLAGAGLSIVNLAEVLSKVAERGADPALVSSGLASIGTLAVLPFDEPQALEVGTLRPPTRDAGLSLGDRACLALARSLGLEVMTGDEPMIEAGRKLGVKFASLR